MLTLVSQVPRMTPILRNRHEKVQEACINLIGRIGESVVLIFDTSTHY
jgi:hypothetical protein